MKTRACSMTIVLLSASFFLFLSGFAMGDSEDEYVSLSENTSYSAEEIGLRKAPLDNEDHVVPPSTRYSSIDPGESTRYERAFENAPPMIPHSVDGLLIITKDFNACVECHMPDVAEEMKAVPVPRTHLVNLRLNKDLDGKLYQGRFFCTLCHAPQAQVDLVVPNEFKAEFREEKDHYSSKLIDNMNEGLGMKQPGFRQSTD